MEDCLHTVRFGGERVVSGVNCHAFVFFVVDSKRRTKIKSEILSSCSVQLDVKRSRFGWIEVQAYAIASLTFMNTEGS